MSAGTSLISDQRKKFHLDLLNQGVLTLSPANKKVQKFGEKYIASNADSGQKMSVQLSNFLINFIAKNVGFVIQTQTKKLKGQTLGHQFEAICASFISNSFKQLQHLRPGDWVVEQVSSRSSLVLGRYEQYSHLSRLSELSNQHEEIKNFLGDGYTVAPDIIVARAPEPDTVINANRLLVDTESAKHTKLRAANHSAEPTKLLHASISCKFTMRSDRAQNTRTEALNLLRTRKSRAPNIVSVTAEPMPSRISSLALGTGDIDCVYHAFLYELEQGLIDLEKEDALDLLRTMIDGKRLKDISDLPLDLAI